MTQLLMYKLIFIITATLYKCTTADWLSPFFITERENDVKIFLKAADYVSIEMEEEIISPFVLCHLNGYDAEDSPRIKQFSQGDLNHLGLKFEKTETRWNMIISKTQDYENENNRRYIFDIEIGNIVVTVDIIVINIFDNPPTVFYENPCSVPELADPVYISACLYNVTDIDGMKGNDIRFEIQGNFNEDKIFDFQLDEESKGEYSQSYKLILKEKLFYDKRFFYSFRVKVFDTGENSFSFNIIVEVENIPNRPPMWIRVFASAKFPEKQSQQFETEAIDGDTGINAPICYKVDFEDDKDFSELISMENNSGKINVKPINRDALKMEVFPFYIVAYECDDEDSWIKSSAVLLVDDINDNIPIINFTDSKDIIEIDEETFLTLFNFDELSVNDIDLGVNAMYNVKLEPNNFASALRIIPDRGYQLQSFSISVLNAKMLDFEVLEFQKFNISIVATELNEEDHWSEKVFEIRLLNWNDELPKFEKDEYVFEVKETVEKDTLIGTVKANDRDIDDKIEYFLSEKLGEKFTLNPSGELITKLERTFDYEQQSEVTFQVFAKDTLSVKGEPTHNTSTQILISVIDVNDTPPTIILPRKFLTVTENELSAIITDEIEVYDPDTTADLILYIDWENSLATGLDVQKDDYLECANIEINEISKNKIIGTLKSSATKIIDYEKFQVLFLTITAVDLNTEVNSNSTSAVLTVFVLDVNDNAPEFVGNTLEVKRSVIEESEADIFIGFIHAIDRDGPGNNDITFTLIPNDDVTTDWIKINPKSGELAVNKSKSIDCDVPKRLGLEYEINISDGELESSGNIFITINDINNKVPKVDSIDKYIEIYENVTDIFLTNVKASDLDRDEPHNIVQYSINYQSNMDLQRYFSINLNTGELRVKELDEANRLDRDTEPSEYSIPIYIEDNLGIGARNNIYATVHIKLLDVNDNAPEMPPYLDFTMVPIYETLQKSSVIVEKLYAPDIDEGLNGEVVYELISITPIQIDREDSLNYNELFVLENYEHKYTRISTGMDLKGYSGKWSIEIKAIDRGNETEGGFSLWSNASYEINIEPVNFEAPTIKYPSKNSVIRLDYGFADVGRTLTLLNGSKLPSFEAIDDDAGIFGDVNFNLDSDPTNSFEFRKLNSKSSHLVLKSDIEEKIYELLILAIDGGNLRSDKMGISLAFIDKRSEPYFGSNEWETIFTENSTGLDETRIIPEAIDPKNFGAEPHDSLFQIFYYLDDTYRPDDAKFFTLDSKTRVLRLREMLDREAIDHHQIRIFASNDDTKPAIRFISDKALLYINITVEDVNDNPPSFVYDKYFVGISERDNFGKILITLEATDPDLDDVITYYILKETITVSNPELDYIKDSAFLLNKDSGALTLNFEVQPTMRGYFEFQVEARDLVNHTDFVPVKIFIVSESNRVMFTFINSVDDIKGADQTVLRKIFTETYNADCVIDDILPRPTQMNSAGSAEADLRAHFIKNNEAIDAQDISQRSSDIVFITGLSSRLSIELSLKLKGVPTSQLTDNSRNTVRNKTLEITLMVIMGVLFVALIAVSIVYIFQRINYKRQIRALSEKKFDPDNTDFKNVKALPNTNIYADQNNIPKIMLDENDEKNFKNFDTKSINSHDSDDFADLPKSNVFNIKHKVLENDSTFA